MRRISSARSSGTNARSAWRLLAGLTVLLLISECVVGGRTVAFLRAARPATATIVANVQMRERHNRSKGAWQPTIEYADDHDQTQRVVFDHGSSLYNYPVGTTAPIYFDPQDPQNVRFDTFMGIWMWPTILAVPILVLAVLALGFRIQANNEARDNPWAADSGTS